MYVEVINSLLLFAWYKISTWEKGRNAIAQPLTASFPDQNPPRTKPPSPVSPSETYPPPRWWVRSSALHFKQRRRAYIINKIIKFPEVWGGSYMFQSSIWFYCRRTQRLHIKNMLSDMPTSKRSQKRDMLMSLQNYFTQIKTVKKMWQTDLSICSNWKHSTFQAFVRE